MRVLRSLKDQGLYPKSRQSKKLGRRFNRMFSKDDLDSMEGSVQDMETTVSSSDFSVGDIALLNDGKAKIPKKKPKGMQESKDFQEPRSEEEPDDEDIEESEEETRLVPFRAPSPGDFFSFLLIFWFMQSSSFACPARMILLCCSIQYCYHCRMHVVLLHHGNMTTVPCM